MRFGDYEIMRSNQWCYQLYRVMPEGFDNSRSKYRESEDGRALRPLDCYPNDLTAAIRRVIGFSEADAVECGDARGVLARLDEIHAELDALADRLKGAEL